MLENFIYAKQKSLFEQKLNDGEVLNEAIVFIEDTKEIWNHGTYFAGSKVDLSNIENSILNILDTKQDAITDLETIRQGAAKGATALQSYTEQYKGTVTGVKINGSTKNPSSGVVDLGTVITSHQDISGKQDKLVSGSNIKTINGTSILGSGNITISGDGVTLTESAAYTYVNHGTSDTTFTLTPNTFHVWGAISALTLSIGSGTSGIANEYFFQFISGSEPTTLILPDYIKFNSDFTIEANKMYQISILNGLGTVMSWDTTIITFYVNDVQYNTYSNTTWIDFIYSEDNPPLYQDTMFKVNDALDASSYAFIANSEDECLYAVIRHSDSLLNATLTECILPKHYISGYS